MRLNGRLNEKLNGKLKCEVECKADVGDFEEECLSLKRKYQHEAGC